MNPPKTLPATLGKYEVKGVLGRGAMGTVYDCWDPFIGRRVAVKTVQLIDATDPEQQEGLARFKNEAKAAGRLSHPNIVPVYDYGEAGETAYIVMEFIEGQSLKERLDTKEPFPVAETVRVMEQMLAALQYSHDKGVVHRDVKPGNVLLAKDGQVKLVDFGIARIESSVMTQAGTMLGTPAYMSPEQLMAQTVDPRSDIYSAGVVLFQMLTGERPFEGGLTTIMHHVLNTDPPRPSERSIVAPPRLDPVVLRALAKHPDERFQTASAFAAAIRMAFNEAGSDEEATRVVTASTPRPHPAAPEVPARAVRAPAPPAPPAVRPTGRRPAVLVGGLVLCVLAGAGGVAWYVTNQPAKLVVPPPKIIAEAPAPPRISPAPVPPQVPPPPAVLPASPPAAQPAQPPAQQPAAIPASTPPPHAPPSAANIASMREIMSAVVRTARCSAVTATVADDGKVIANGVAGNGAPEAALHDAVLAAAPGSALTWGVEQINPTYCDALDVVRPLIQPGGPPFSLALKDDATRLKEHELVLPVLRLPDFPTFLTVDYLSHDGSVAHLYPVKSTPNTALPANASVRLGTEAKDRIEVAPPFGADLIIATVSSVPLFSVIRDDEKMQTYLPALRAAIDTAQRRNAKLSSRVLLLVTLPR